MTMIEYLEYLMRNKGVLFGKESKIESIIQDDFDKLKKSHFIEIDYYNNEVETVYLTDKGYNYISNLD